MVAEVDEVLRQAVLEKSALRLTVEQFPGALAARALQSSDKPGALGLWIHLYESDVNVVSKLAKALPELSATFAIRQDRYAFESKIIARDPRFWMNDTVMLDALLLAAPLEVHLVQQRREQRLPVSEGSGVSAQLFRLDKSTGGAGTLVAIDGKLNDLSLCGGGFICPPDKSVLAAKCGERLACIVDFRGAKLVLVASIARVTKLPNRAMRVGVDFAAHGHEKAMAGKLANLANVLKELERQESLRHR